MTTASIYIAVRKYSWQSSPQIVIDDRDMTDIHAGDCSSVVLYKVLEVREIEIPDMPTPAELASVEIEGLESMRDRIQAEARSKVEKVNERIANLRCLEHMEE